MDLQQRIPVYWLWPVSPNHKIMIQNGSSPFQGTKLFFYYTLTSNIQESGFDLFGGGKGFLFMKY